MLTLFFVLMSAQEKITYAAGYIANIQFAPFYVAISRGYYRDEGILLDMDYTIGPDVFKLVALERVQFGSADPDAFLNAAVRDLPLVHVATLYQHYPVALISKKPISGKKDVQDKKIGISGAYGSSYMGLKAMLRELGLGLSDVRVMPIGFTQVAALQQDKVDVVVGYINNEPERLKSLGVDVHTYTLNHQNHIPGVGLMTSKSYLKQNPEKVKGFLRATFRGMHDILQDPKGCYDLVVSTYLPQLSAPQRYEAEYKILLATLPFWQSEYVRTQGFGQCDPRSWERLAEQLAKDQNDKDYLQWRKWLDRDFHWKPAGAVKKP